MKNRILIFLFLISFFGNSSTFAGEQSLPKDSIELRVYQFKGKDNPDLENLALDPTDDSKISLLNKEQWELILPAEKKGRSRLYDLLPGKFYLVEGLNIPPVLDMLNTTMDDIYLVKQKNKTFCDRPIYHYMGKFENDTRRAWLINTPNQRKNKMGEFSVEAIEISLSRRTAKIYVTY